MCTCSRSRASSLAPPPKRRALRHRRRRSVEMAEALLDLGDHRGMLDRAGRRHHHVGPAIVARQISAQVPVLERAHALRRAEDRAPHRLARERARLQIVEHEIVGRVLGRTDLLHDDVLLALELVRIELRIRQDVGQHVERERHVAFQHAGVVGGGLEARRGVDVAANRLDLLGDLARAAALGALERHVFQEMRDAVLVRPLVAAAGADPDAERRGLQMRHAVGDDRQAGREDE